MGEALATLWALGLAQAKEVAKVCPKVKELDLATAQMTVMKTVSP